VPAGYVLYGAVTVTVQVSVTVAQTLDGGGMIGPPGVELGGGGGGFGMEVLL